MVIRFVANAIQSEVKTINFLFSFIFCKSWTSYSAKQPNLHLQVPFPASLCPLLLRPVSSKGSSESSDDDDTKTPELQYGIILEWLQKRFYLFVYMCLPGEQNNIAPVAVEFWNYYYTHVCTLLVASMGGRLKYFAKFGALDWLCQSSKISALRNKLPFVSIIVFSRYGHICLFSNVLTFYLILLENF